MAQVSAVITDQTPVTADGDVPPHSGLARKLRSSRGNTMSDRTRLTRMTTTIGAPAAAIDGGAGAAVPWTISAGSNSRAVVARSRRVSSPARTSAERGAPSPKPSPLLFAAASSRASHHMPNASMIIEASTPSPGAAKGVVPKNGIGIVFWIDGVPGIADMVKVEVPSMIAAGIRRRGISALRNRSCAIGAMTKKATNRLTPP